jgi:prepilin peptidase CpaA
MVENAVLVVLLLVVMYTDARWTRIPNVITYPAILIGLALGGLESFPGAVFGQGLLDHLGALVLAFAFSFPLYQFGGIKAGDAKLLMAVGALRGTTFFIVSTVYGAVLGGVFALLFIAIRLVRAARAGQPMPLSKTMKSWMPYGIALALGGLLALALEVTRTTSVGPA